MKVDPLNVTSGMFEKEYVIKTCMDTLNDINFAMDVVFTHYRKTFLRKEWSWRKFKTVDVPFTWSELTPSRYLQNTDRDRQIIQSILDMTSASYGPLVVISAKDHALINGLWERPPNHWRQTSWREA